jgi:hypothetical protein
MIDIPFEYHVCDIYISKITCGPEEAFYFIEGHERTLFQTKKELSQALQKRADQLFAKQSKKNFDVTAYLKADWLEHWAKEFDASDGCVQSDSKKEEQ